MKKSKHTLTFAPSRLCGKILLSIAPLICFSQEKYSPPVIPLPVETISRPGNFSINENTVVVVEQQDVKIHGNYFIERIYKLFGLQLKMANEVPAIGKYIRLLQVDSDGDINEYYQIRSSENFVMISGESNIGILFGIQSLFQLISENGKGGFFIPCLEINDYPGYQWRGMHLDVCRHFFSKDEIKKYLDLLALYKFNVFHWHLTEDQGWRIEIKKYPKLTGTGSLRKETVIGKQNDKALFDKKPYGGFYTQEDIREIVAYASSLHIMVVPEIEMPGHSLAALASYPHFSCTGGPFEVGTRWGVYDDVYCAGNDSVFVFLENILTEVISLFPGKYIHIGGDECPKERWKKCPKCQKRIKDENLKDEHELQSYFIRRIEKFLNSKAKTIIGWDEILEGGLAPNALVMSWRGTQGGIDAAKQNHNVIMTPGKPCYFDHYQSLEKNKEPLAIGGFNPLDSVYNYNPIPPEVQEDVAQYILGAQGNVWTEYIVNFSQVEYMAVPRMAALSEALWIPPGKKDYPDFVSRLKVHSNLLDRMKVNYAKHFINQK